VLDPRIFFVVGFARGGDIVAGPKALPSSDPLAGLDRDETVTLDASVGSTAALLGLFAFDTAGIDVRLSDARADDAPSPWRANAWRRLTRFASSKSRSVALLSPDARPRKGSRESHAM